MVVCVKNASGFISVDRDGTWVCTGSHKTERLPDPVSYKSDLISFLGVSGYDDAKTA